MHNYNDNSPVYLQIKEKLAIQIFNRHLKPGTQLPSIREIALVERVNPNTVQRALAELERDGLIFSKSTNGKFVTDDIELIRQKREDYADKLSQTYEQKMRDIGRALRNKI